ncbi:uncharacterized protein LOC114936024 [Nylanderia fulva]|uniref:uncharacterized protein LOC114936024 n=1 Tax=Nylanderia fulva TaxID=613905 RepID=UPI0010FB2C3A|nr:uncharacterized protein LOC114936024 [Nylanderia fulva]
MPQIRRLLKKLLTIVELTIQLALNPVTKEIVSPECDESGAGASCSGLIATKSTVIEEKTIPETVNVISPGTGFKEQAENSTVVKQEGQIKNSNSMFCTDKSKGILIGDNVYCTSKLYKIANESNSATKAVRRLLEGVFTLESLLQCTVSGLSPRGKGCQAYADPNSIKKFLEPAGVDAIIDKALEWQKIKHWRPKKDSTQLRSAMAVRLCEIREKEQKRQSNKSKV